MADDDKDLLAAYLSGVTPLSRPPAGKPPAKPVHPQRAPVRAPTPVRGAPTHAHTPAKEVGAGPASLTAQINRLEMALDAMRRELSEARAGHDATLASVRTALATSDAAIADAQGGVAAARSDASAARAELADAHQRIAHLTAQLAEVDAHRKSLQATLSAEPTAPPRAPLRSLLDRRGLVGDDEHTLALRALFDARREKPLLDLLAASDSAAVEAYLAMHVRLIAEGEEIPAGVATVRVAADRSESPKSATNARAIRLFNDACLIRSYKRVVIVGGSPSMRRILKEGIDPRIKVSYVEGDNHSPSQPDADLVIVWALSELEHAGASHFPNGVIASHRSISQMLEFVVDYLKTSR